MAESIFTQCDGVVARLPVTCNNDTLLFKISFDGEQIYLPVTGFALEMGGNYQFLHTVSDFIYFYSFGDRISELNITGMAFIRRACNTGFGVNTTFPSYFNPGNYNLNPFDPAFANDPRWVQASETWIGLNRESNSVCDLYDFYMRNRTAAKPAAIRVTFGNCAAFWGFLTGMRLEIARPDVPIAQWVLRLNVIPK